MDKDTVSQESESARVHLAEAIETCVGATTALGTATRAPYNLTPAFEKKDDSLNLDQLGLDGARAILAKTRNSRCSPINQLPSELLVYIFKIFVDSAYPSDFPDTNYTNPATILTRVCSHWHWTALQAGPLWSCVVLMLRRGPIRETVLNLAKMRLERTYGSAIDLFIGRTPYRTPNDSQLQTAIDLLGPYMRQLRSLQLMFLNFHELQSVLDCWLDHGAAGSLSEFRVTTSAAHPPLFRESNPRSPIQLAGLFRSIRILSLNQVGFDWSTVAFKGLDELTLCNIEPSECPGPTQLAKILSASPGLRLLNLTYITIRQWTQSTTPPPVKLSFLETLTLIGLTDADIRTLVSILSLGQQELKLVISNNYSAPITLASLRSLVSGANIHTIQLTNVTFYIPLHEILESLPRLKGLGLCIARLRVDDLNALVRRNIMNNVPPTSALIQTDSAIPHSKIERLGLVHCTFICDQATFREAICNISLNILSLHSCKIAPHPYTPAEPDNIDAESELGVWLAELMPGRVHLA